MLSSTYRCAIFRSIALTPKLRPQLIASSVQVYNRDEKHIILKGYHDPQTAIVFRVAANRVIPIRINLMERYAGTGQDANRDAIARVFRECLGSTPETGIGPEGPRKKRCTKRCERRI